MLWLKANYKSILYSLLAAFIAGYAGYYIGLFEAKSRAETKVELRYVTAVLEGEQKRDAKKQEVNSLSNDELIKRYCNWVYDVPYDYCVQTTVFIE